ncbi:MAG TPA: hypothetical protein VK929_08915 [Longimicrobiales bacterium]|nr:hypothetical protein [Longimicrobiales bacterium]
MAGVALACGITAGIGLEPALHLQGLEAQAVQVSSARPGSIVVAAQAIAAQQGLAEVSSSEFSLSRETAVLRLDLADGRSIEAAIRDGAAWVDGTRIGDAPRGGELDRSWRELLNQGMDVPSAELPALLAGWSAPGAVGEGMATSLRDVLQVATPAGAGAAPAASGDTVDRLMQRIERLEQERRDAERALEQAERRAARAAAAPSSSRRGVFYHVSRGLEGVFSVMVTYIVLFGIAFVTIFFGGRKYIEGVADTARHATGRSMLVGLAGGFLVIPAFVLGIIALAISVVGIPALLVWVPLYPVAVVLALILGYLGLAHAAGEAMAERRFYVNDWVRRGNSYYFLLSGLGLLLAFFLAANVVRMAGPWMGFMHGLLMFIGSAITFFALCTGFGAVLLSRGGTQPVRKGGITEEHDDLFREEANV